MKYAATLIGTLFISSTLMAQTKICKVKELSYNGIGTVVVATHLLEITTLDQVSLDLGFSGKKVQLTRTFSDGNSEFISANVTDLATGKSLASSKMESDLKVGDDYGRSVLISCTSEVIK